MLLYTHKLFDDDGYVKVAQYGSCISAGSRFIETVFTYLLPIFTAAFLSLVLNIYLSIKAYQIQKKIEGETRLRGFTTDLKAMKTKQAAIKKNLKPMITLLVIVLGSAAIGLLSPLLFIIVKVLAPNSVYDEVVRLAIGSNVGYLVLLLHPFVYGLYFKQIREPMMKLLKGRLCADHSVAAIAPQPRRMAWM